MKTYSSLRNMGLGSSFTIYIAAGLLMFLLTKYLIPHLSGITGLEPVLFWFIVAGLGVFLPLLILAIIILRKEGYRMNTGTWKHRLRFRPLSRNELLWTFGGLISILLLSGLVMTLLQALTGGFDHSPPFMAFEPLDAGRYWFLLVWLPYWILNILGEEILWRGVMLPRQEISFGNKTWLIHGFGWGIFHVAFGWQLLITLVPILFILPFVVQKTKNTWSGVIIHAGINGPSFIAIAMGWI